MTKSKNTKQSKHRASQATKQSNKTTLSKRSPKKSSAGVDAATSAARAGSKLAALIALLRRPQGATIEQMAKHTGWQNHSVRGAISGALKKKMGLTVLSGMEGDARIYRIAEGAR